MRCEAIIEPGGSRAGGACTARNGGVTTRALVPPCSRSSRSSDRAEASVCTGEIERESSIWDSDSDRLRSSAESFISGTAASGRESTRCSAGCSARAALLGIVICTADITCEACPAPRPDATPAAPELDGALGDILAACAIANVDCGVCVPASFSSLVCVPTVERGDAVDPWTAVPDPISATVGEEYTSC